jgi:hypothetical protein
MKRWISCTARGAREIGAAGRGRAKDTGFSSEYLFVGRRHGSTLELYRPAIFFDLTYKANGMPR